MAGISKRWGLLLGYLVADILPYEYLAYTLAAGFLSVYTAYRITKAISYALIVAGPPLPVLGVKGYTAYQGVGVKPPNALAVLYDAGTIIARMARGELIGVLIAYVAAVAVYLYPLLYRFRSMFCRLVFQFQTTRYRLLVRGFSATLLLSSPLHAAIPLSIVLTLFFWHIPLNESLYSLLALIATEGLAFHTLMLVVYIVTGRVDVSIFAMLTYVLAASYLLYSTRLAVYMGFAVVLAALLLPLVSLWRGVWKC